VLERGRGDIFEGSRFHGLAVNQSAVPQFGEPRPSMRCAPARVKIAALVPLI
jgi:hypothetical protein